MDGAGDVEFAAVVFRTVVAEVDEQVTDGLVCPGVRLAANPHRVVVELDVLLRGAAKDHASEVAIAERQGVLLTAFGRGIIPEDARDFHCGERVDEEEGG